MYWFRFLVAYRFFFLLRYIMRASTQYHLFLSTVQNNYHTYIYSDFSAHLPQCLYPFDLIHESAELLGTVLPLPPPSLSYVSVSWPSAIEFFWLGARLDRKNDEKEINSEISIWTSPPTTKKFMYLYREEPKIGTPDQFARLDSTRRNHISLVCGSR
jgi:hypothetical protein